MKLMKKFLLTLVFAIGISTLAPLAAQAHCDRPRVILYYDHCGRPVYGYVDDDDYYYYRRPARHYYRSYDYSPRYCYPRRTGFTFYFGR